MSAIEHRFFGRDSEIGWLLSQVWDIRHSFDCPRVVLVHGPKGGGKRSLFKMALRRIREDPAARPAAVFSNLLEQPSHSLESFAQLLLNSGSCSGVPRTQPDLPSEEDRKAGSVDRDQVMKSYRPQGRMSFFDDVAGPLGAKQNRELTMRFVEGLSDWMAVMPQGLQTHPKMRLVFVLADFDELPVPYRSWLGNSLATALYETAGIPPQVYLLSGQKSWEDGKQADYWMLPPAAFAQSAIRPLERSACIEWLKSLSREPEGVDELLDATDGLPGRIAQILHNGKQFEPNGGTEHDGLLSALPARQRRWLHAAALLEPISPEGLCVLLGREEGNLAFTWLYGEANLPGLKAFVLSGKEHVSLSDGTRKAIVDFASRMRPVRHRDFLDRMRIHQSLRRKVPSEADRARLRQLAAMQPFDLSIVQEVFSEDE